MASNRWTDAFLDSMSKQGDPLADDFLIRIMRDNKMANIRRIFAEMDSNNEIPPATMFPELSDFFAATHNLPSDVDLDRMFPCAYFERVANLSTSFLIGFSVRRYL